MKTPDEKSYDRDYNRGWKSSGGSADTLDRADADGRSSIKAWMDGYMDYAVGRPKFHLRDCQGCDDCNK